MRQLLLLTACLFLCSTAWGSAGMPWETFGYDGREFLKGGGEASISIRDGYLPISADVSVQREDQLPPGTGAVALLCYQERSGGKLKPQQRVAPLPGVAVTLAGTSVTVAGRTDSNGYLVLALPPGAYQVRWLGFTTNVKVEKGKSALVALRGSKRMVD